MKCLANLDNTELHSQLLHLSRPSSSIRKCTDRIVGWRDCAGNYEQSGSSGNRAQETPKEKQMIRDFMQRNAPSSTEKRYDFQHHLDADDYILQYRLQHTMHITNSASLLYLSQFTSIVSNMGSTNSATAKRTIFDQNHETSEKAVLEMECQPEIGTTYMNGVWTIAQKYHLAPPSLTQYTNWWKFGDQGKIEQDSKIPVFGKGITPAGRNISMTKCNLKFPSETTNSAQLKRKMSESKKASKDDQQEKIKDLGKINNEDLRDASCKFFTAVLEQRLNQLKQRQEELEKYEHIERPLSSSSVSKKKLSLDNNTKKGNNIEPLEVTSKIPLFPPSVKRTHSGHRSSLPHVPPVNFMSVRELSDK